MNKAFDVRHPFFAPLYRRVLVVAVCLIWAGVEGWSGNTFWAALFGAAGVWLAYQFFVVFDPEAYRRDTPPRSDKEET